MRALLVSVLLAACGGGASTGTAIVGNEARRALPAAGPTALLALVPDGAGCILARVELDLQPLVLGRFVKPCTGGRIATSSDEYRYVVSFGSSEIYEINAGASTPVRALPPWTESDPIQLLAIGTAKPHAIYAFTTHELPGSTGIVTYRGFPLDFTQTYDGTTAAALAFQEAEVGWKLRAAVSTTTGATWASGYRALDLVKTMAPESGTLIDPYVQVRPISDLSTVFPLEALAPTPGSQNDDWWMQVPAGEHDVYAWVLVREHNYTSGLLAWRSKTGQIDRLPGLTTTAADQASIIMIDGRYMLVEDAVTGGRPRLYDLETHELVYSSDTAVATLPWKPLPTM